MNATRFNKLSLAIGLSIATTSALASPQAFMSSRSFAMAGTGVAVSAPSAAPSTNPAMMASQQHDWADDFGVMLPSFNIRAADEEETVDQIDGIQAVIEDFNKKASSFDKNSDAEDVRSLQNTTKELNRRLTAFNNDTVRANIGLGVALAAPSPKFSIGAFTSGNVTATARGEWDDSGDDSDSSLLTRISNADSAADIDDILDQSKKVERDNAGNTSIKLDSRGRILASAVIEAGVSFASTFELNNETSFQAGISPKYVQLRTYQYTETVSGFEDDEFDGDDYQTEKSGFNLDVGAAYAFGEQQEWNAGVVVKNLIPMELDSAQSRPALEDKYTLELNPMVTAAIAHKGAYHVVTAELDLTKKEAFGYEDDTQWLAVGAEFDAWRYAQLRAGVRHNLASNSDNDGIEETTQFTAGFGLNVLGARLDLGALYSSADVGAAIEFGASF
ncbi:conjugal transfer protein TraF [Marinobacter sp. MDS2]|uniref:conjugal transfer protein TraF n=1 Tax=Marinobacter sp. MDS2 TaxID=3065961 RepID=UPI00273B7EDD|nr:conjugal transfer protein TraF [Marinobacter sp. MDS2]MDP4547286.1 conjugal transfer protein TraF [Marinobacter sp. MDS2]